MHPYEIFVNCISEDKFSESVALRNEDEDSSSVADSASGTDTSSSDTTSGPTFSLAESQLSDNAIGSPSQMGTLLMEVANSSFLKNLASQNQGNNDDPECKSYHTMPSPD